MTKIEREARRAWLTELKDGDEVCVEWSAGGLCSYPICKIRKIGNFFDVENHGEFIRLNGRTESSLFHSPKWILPATPERRQMALVAVARSRIRYEVPGKWQQISDATALAIVELLDSDEAEKKGP